MISRRAVLAAVFSAAALSGCMSRMQAGRGTGRDPLDFTVGVLPVSGSLNPDQNMYPGLANAMDRYGLFASVEPAASSRGKKFDILLMAEPPGFAPKIKAVSGYSGKVILERKVTALYGMGAKTAAFALYDALKVGSPAYQDLAAERQIAMTPKAALLPSAAGAPQPAAPPVVSEVDRPAYSLAPSADDFAVVVGVESYPRLPKADYAERDAAAVREHLLALGYPARNVALLTGQDASRAGIAKMVETWLPRNAKAGSTVFFYYSGHGAPDPLSGASFLVPFDGDPQFLDDTAYPVARLYEKLSRLPARRVVVALDACFSGAGGRSVMAPGARPLVAKAAAMGVPARVAALTASAADQITGSAPDQGHGLFTYYLLKGLNESRGKADLRGLHKYLAPKVADDARLQNREQTPQLFAADGLDLSLR